MDERKMKELFDLVDDLKRLSARPNDKSDSFSRGLSYGRSVAYLCCAEWLEEIIR